MRLAALVLLCGGLAPSSGQNATEQRAAARSAAEPRTNLQDDGHVLMQGDGGGKADANQ